MRILFIYPQINSQISFNYGVSYIAGLLKRDGHAVKLLNISKDLDYPLDLEKIEKDTIEFSPDVIAFSIVTPQVKYALRILHHLKRKLDVPYIAGGVHPTMDPEGMLKSGFDYVCRGEGELFFKAFLKFLQGDARIEDVPNICFMKNGKIVKNPLAPFVDISMLPQKDYTIFDFQSMIDRKNGWVGLMASRGCPFKCSYCVNHAYLKMYKSELGISSYKNYIRFHKPEQVLSEIDFLLTNYKNISFFIFDDDLFTFKKDFVEAFCRLYKMEKIKIPFVVNAHVKFFDRDMAKWLKEAGCKIVKFGIESGNERIRRKILNRHMSNEEMKKAISICEETGLHSSCFVMLGLPSETKKEMMDTIRFLAEAKPGRFRWSVFYPFPGTRAYEICEEMGILPENIGDLDNFFEGTCLLLREDERFMIEKLAKIYPWLVNSFLDDPIGKVFKGITSYVMDLDKKAWDRFKEKYREIDGLLDKIMGDDLHYSIKFNPFMAVRNDWEE